MASALRRTGALSQDKWISQQAISEPTSIHSLLDSLTASDIDKFVLYIDFGGNLRLFLGFFLYV